MYVAERPTMPVKNLKPTSKFLAIIYITVKIPLNLRKGFRYDKLEHTLFPILVSSLK